MFRHVFNFLLLPSHTLTMHRACYALLHADCLHVPGCFMLHGLWTDLDTVLLLHAGCPARAMLFLTQTWTVAETMQQASSAVKAKNHYTSHTLISGDILLYNVRWHNFRNHAALNCTLAELQLMFHYALRLHCCRCRVECLMLNEQQE